MILEAIRKRWPWVKHLFADGAYDRLKLMNKAAYLDFVIEIIRRSDDQKGFASIFVYPDYPLKTIYPSINLGYRRYGKNSLFRVGLAPGMIQGKLIPGGYISYGFTF